MSQNKTIGIGMIGLGTVGSGVAKLIKEQNDLYAKRLTGTRLELRRVMVRPQDLEKARQSGLVSNDVLTTDAKAFFDTPDMQIMVELAGGAGPIADFVRQALTMGKHVVTANKSLLALHGTELFALARSRSVSLAFEASCCGGIPVITAMQFGLMGNRIDALFGILNGTCNYILSEMTQKGKSYEQALKEAQAQGFAEANPTLDVSGADTAQKLSILASLAFGLDIKGEQVPMKGIDRIDLADVRFAAELGYDIKLLGMAERSADGQVSLSVQPCYVPKTLLIANVHGAFNALSIFGHATGHTMYYGRGAGMMPTAGAVVSDILNIASGWYPKAFAEMTLWCDRHPKANLVPADELASRFYLRINALDQPGTLAAVTTILGQHQIGISAVMQHEHQAGQFVPVVLLTDVAKAGNVRQAIGEIQKLSQVSGEPVCVRILDMPKG